jgi:hypothetical protein
MAARHRKVTRRATKIATIGAATATATTLTVCAAPARTANAAGAIVSAAAGALTGATAGNTESGLGLDLSDPLDLSGLQLPGVKPTGMAYPDVVANQDTKPSLSVRDLNMILPRNPGRGNGGLAARFVPEFALLGINAVTPDVSSSIQTSDSGAVLSQSKSMRRWNTTPCRTSPPGRTVGGVQNQIKTPADKVGASLTEKDDKQ